MRIIILKQLNNIGVTTLHSSVVTHPLEKKTKRKRLSLKKLPLLRKEKKESPYPPQREKKREKIYKKEKRERAPLLPPNKKKGGFPPEKAPWETEKAKKTAPFPYGHRGARHLILPRRSSGGARGWALSFASTPVSSALPCGLRQKLTLLFFLIIKACRAPDALPGRGYG